MVRDEFDVAIVGFGPVGALMANLLGQAGRRVLVLERAESVYPLPRAVNFDAEIMRVFQSLGLAQEMSAISRPLAGAEFVKKSGERILGVAMSEIVNGPLGWPLMNLFYQPNLERVLRAGAQRFQSVDVRLRHEATELEQDADRVRIGFRDLSSDQMGSATARYLLGADGAGSFTRRRLGIQFESLNYDREWLVIDTQLRRHVDLPELAQQICDPERITTFVPSEGANRRWEFRLRAGETREEMERSERVWELLSPWIGPDDAELIRAVVYEFHGTVAERWRDGHVLLMGDAAHQMPPFMGQGMCSGMRDADNLCWKLGLVLDGQAPDGLLDTYQSERKPHADDMVDWAVAVGKLIDAFTRAEAGQESGHPTASEQASGYGGERRMLRLGPGVLQTDPPPGAAVGEPFPQSRVRTPAGEVRLLDELLGPGFALVLRGEPQPLLGDETRAFCESLDARVLSLDRLELLDGWLAPIFETARAAIVRPDHYLAGVASTPEQLAALSKELRERIGSPLPT